MLFLFESKSKMADNNHSMFLKRDSDTLVQKCLAVLIKNFGEFELEMYEKLPRNLNSLLLRTLSKRGLITDDNIQAFLNENTKVLELSECDKISDIGLAKISVCRNLVKLDMNVNSSGSPRSSITSEGISAVVTSLKSLREIYLRRCINVDDSTVDVISRNCPFLGSLNIGNCPLISNKALVSLGKNCRNLRSINVSGTSVSDEGIFGLITDPVASSLVEVHIAHCALITDESIECILMHCKKIKYLLFHSCPKTTEASRMALEDYMSTSTNQKVKHLTWTIY